jgi:hypothetical protein
MFGAVKYEHWGLWIPLGRYGGKQKFPLRHTHASLRGAKKVAGVVPKRLFKSPVRRACSI